MEIGDLDKSFQMSTKYLLTKIGFDTTENEPCKVCPLSECRSPRFGSLDRTSVASPPLPSLLLHQEEEIDIKLHQRSERLCIFRSCAD